MNKRIWIIIVSAISVAVITVLCLTTVFAFTLFTNKSESSLFNEQTETIWICEENKICLYVDNSQNIYGTYIKDSKENILNADLLDDCYISINNIDNQTVLFGNYELNRDVLIIKIIESKLESVNSNDKIKFIKTDIIPDWALKVNIIDNTEKSTETDNAYRDTDTDTDTDKPNAGNNFEDEFFDFFNRLDTQNVDPNIFSDTSDDDSDGLTNAFEDYIGTDKKNNDCDGDGLTDFEEIMRIGTSPLKVDTNGNGISDADEDADGDKISNIDELRKYNSAPDEKDSDYDGLSDYDEIFVYKTKPNAVDSDGDGLYDGEEIKLKLNPNKKDSNNNGILDGDEKIYQEFEPDLEFDESSPVVGIKLAFAGTGDISQRTVVKDMLNIDVLSSSVVTLVGSPYEFATYSDYDEVTITFKIDKTRLTQYPFNELGIMWHNEETDFYDIIDSVTDYENSTITATVPCMGTYMVADTVQFADIMSDYFFSLEDYFNRLKN